MRSPKASSRTICWLRPPASPLCGPRSIDGIQYLDGGYGDNMPTALAARMGAEELVCVDLEGVGITRPNRHRTAHHPGAQPLGSGRHPAL